MRLSPWKLGFAVQAENNQFEESVLEALWDGCLTYLLLIFFLDTFLVKLLHTSSPSFISFCARTTTLPVGDTKNLEIFFLGFPHRRSCPPAVGQAVVGEK